MIPKEIEERLEAQIKDLEIKIMRDYKIAKWLYIVAILLTGSVAIYDIFINRHLCAIYMVCLLILSVIALMKNCYWHKEFKEKAERLNKRQQLFKERLRRLPPEDL